ncbi:uncharacterized protein CC84DRAFT_1091120 [Paraphaeosphaeria sporulosa]|uniref:Hemerythrin-like domain-containing protein n=1 Tax=Paraphaeosphaeria sporulosa TaxID=1460663 RepID=A0A177CF28_9PLEO|nr:uncharacterized protein CC84DRAFT_1091120 [Paraphaeosphaeria sporulosa]OAG05357.1 hypothetical protein CC84DRAFT_1091120 [Paraphaeosphaeria sporulosa]
MAPSTPAWADGPLPLIQTPSATKDTNDHPAHYIANEMAWAHNAMLRGLNAIYLQAPHVQQGDAADFLFFIASWSAWVLHHHTIEEKQMFPGFEAVPGVAPGSLSHNVEQHHEFSEGLSGLQKYATATTADSYSGAHVQKLVDGFSPILRQHLADEIDTLWAMDSVAANTEHSKKLLNIYQQCEAEAGKQDKSVVPPMVLGLCDKTFEGGNDWPKMPMGSAYFVHYLFARKHSKAWRFLPCDTFGKPRPLAFLGNNGAGK